MKSSYLKWVVLALFAASLCLAQTPMPMMKVLEPANGKVGDIITVTGENLDKGSIAKLLITDYTADTPVTIEEQTATTLKFKIPAVKPGRFSLVLLTKGKDPKEIVQPVRLTVDE